MSPPSAAPRRGSSPRRRAAPDDAASAARRCSAPQDRGQQVVEVVGDATRQPADRLELLAFRSSSSRPRRAVTSRPAPTIPTTRPSRRRRRCRPRRASASRWTASARCSMYAMCGGRYRASIARAVALAVVLVDEGHEVVARAAPPPSSEHPAVARAREEEAPGGVDLDDEVRLVLDEQAVLLLAPRCASAATPGVPRLTLATSASSSRQDNDEAEELGGDRRPAGRRREGQGPAPGDRRVERASVMRSRSRGAPVPKRSAAQASSGSSRISSRTRPGCGARKTSQTVTRRGPTSPTPPGTSRRAMRRASGRRGPGEQQGPDGQHAEPEADP